MAGFGASGGAATRGKRWRHVVLAAAGLTAVGGPMVRPHATASRLPAAEPPAQAASSAAPAAPLDPLSATTLMAAQAAELVRTQETKPRFPTTGDEAAARAALQAAGAGEAFDRLVAHGETFVNDRQRRVYGRGLPLKVNDLAKDEVGRQRLLLAQHPDYSQIANRFADFLHLPSMMVLSPEAADALSEFKGSICLSRLQRLDSARLAKKLAGQPLVVLRVVQAIDAAAADALAAGDAHIELPLLMSLDSAALARKLSARPKLALHMLRGLGPQAAAGLAEGQGTIELPELRSLGPGVAQAIAGSRALFQFGILDLTPAEADILARGTVRLAVTQIGIDSPALLEKLVAASPSMSMTAPTLSEASARALAKCTVAVGLQNVTTLTVRGKSHPWPFSTWPTAGKAEVFHGRQPPHRAPADFFHSLLSPEAAAALAATPGYLHFVRLSALDSVQLAEKLARQRSGGGLRLPLKSVSPEIAAILARTEGDLQLDAIATLDPEAAAALAARTGPLSLAGLEQLDSPALAERLAKPVTSFPKLTSVSPEAAASLVRGATEKLELGTPNPDAALLESLSACSGDLLLAALESPTPEHLALVEKARCRSLTLGVRRLTPELVRQLEKLPMELRLPLVRTLSEETVATLADSPLRVGLAGLDIKSQPAGVLERLVANPRVSGTFYQGLPRLTVAMAAGLAGRPGPVMLNVEAIDTPDAVAIATNLATKQGPLQIPKLKRLSPKTLSALLDKPDIEIPRVADLELINEPDGSPTDDFVIPRGYEDRKTTPPVRGR